MPSERWNDRNFVLQKLKQDIFAFAKASQELRKDREIVLEAVKQNGWALMYTSQELQNDREFVLEAVKQNGYALMYTSQELRKDREFVLEAVKQNGYALVFASQELQNDREFVLEAVKQNEYALMYTSQELRNDREIVLEAVKQNEYALMYTSQELRNDREFVLEAVKQNGWALMYTSQELRNDREIVLEAVKQDGYALLLASQELRNDREFVLEAVKQNRYALQFASQEAQKDPEIVLEAVKQDGYALLLASQELQNDREFVLEAVKQNGWALMYTSQELRNDLEIVLEAVKQDGYALVFASQELRNDKEIVLEAMKQNEVAFEYTSEELKINAEWLLKICNENNRLKKYIQEELFGIIEKAKQGIARNIKLFLLLKPSLQQHPEIINSIIQEGPKQFSFSSNFDEIIEYYSNNFVSDQNAFDFYLYLNLKPKATFSLFSSDYPKEMVIEFALMKLFHKFITSHHVDLNAMTIQHTIDYYLFSDTIHNFVEHLWSTLKPIHYKQLQKVVNNIVQGFPIEKISESCIGFIVKFLNDWKQMKAFPRLTSIQQLTQQNLSKRGPELAKILQCCQIAKSQPQFKTIHFISFLGMGAQGVVLRCLYKNHGMVACKLFFEPTNDPNRLKEQFKVIKDECMKEHVLKCQECNTIECNGSHYPYIIMEIGKHTLKEKIHSIHSNKISKYYKRESTSKFLEKIDLIWILNCFIDILKAVTALHGMNMLHRDLKPENIMLTQEEKPKLIDLDASRNLQYRHSVTVNVGTWEYLAPEAQHDQVSRIENNTTVSKFCDVFSLGCTFMKMLTNCSLRLDGTYLNSQEQDLYENQHQTTNNTGDMNYFSEYGGSYFYVAVATSHGESKLHHALYKELDKHIDPSWKVNDILGRCLMTMIQKDIETRRDCVRYIPILQAVKQSLEKGINNPDFSSLDLSILKEYQPSFIEKMMKENKRLKQDNDNLLSENRQIKEDNANLLSENRQMKDKYEKLLAYMEKHSINFE